MDWKYYVEKKVYIVLKNNRRYSGKVLEVDDDNPNLIWLTILDKYNKRVTFSVEEIKSIQEED